MIDSTSRQPFIHVHHTRIMKIFRCRHVRNNHNPFFSHSANRNMILYYMMMIVSCCPSPYAVWPSIGPALPQSPHILKPARGTVPHMGDGHSATRTPLPARRPAQSPHTQCHQHVVLYRHLGWQLRNAHTTTRPTTWSEVNARAVANTLY